ncbi:GGDEF domain-containing protein [Vibrio sp. Of7-15]|uniref:GGDEF domain-containing protein n=1 Tax=Vibrio sp. Of7-15 TaxID=2724879 RepID=UPI001EF220B0|nr:GGDEF domain-containing protein [Vibrio sp. Of7-15]MCG7495265.1 GGDEF domain-containing protein [Vibrio sp. Of7-15]
MSFSLINHPGFRLLLPIIFAVASISGMDGIIALSSDNQDFTYILPYILLGLAILLSQPFNQGRTGLIALVMAITYYLIQSRLQVPLHYGTARIEFTLLALLLPVSLMAVFIFPDRRIMSRYGAGFLAILIFMLGWCLLIIQHFSENDMSWLWQSYFLSLPNVSPLPLVVVLYSVLMCCVAAILILTRNESTDQAIFASLLLASLTFSLFHVDYVSSTFFSLAGILLILNIIATSHELAFIDQLTNIPGRRALEAEMKHLGRKYAIAMLDVDHFKKFNDTYGHDTGDDVLKLVARIMADTNGGAKVYRYGGEEFTVLFKGKTAEQSIEYLDELREDIANYDLVIRNKDDRPKSDEEGTQKRGKGNQSKVVNVTISIGVADSSVAAKPVKVIKAADEALYRAKKGGRNKVST